MQQGGGGGAGSQYGEMSTTPPATAALSTHMLPGGTSDQSQQQLVEEASPISSRPPATAAVGNLDEFMRLSGAGGIGLADEDEADRGGGVGGSGNRWPRQETLALIQIRSEMDAAFRDATLKGPLWEHVSRKLAELGYKRSAKKCKEKFENVHKYYKRTKEGRAGRQDGKSYRFFTQLEALHNTSTAPASTSAIINVSSSSQPTPTATTVAPTATLDVAPVSIGIPNPMPIRNPSSQPPPTMGVLPPELITSTAVAPPPVAVPAQTTTGTSLGISFSSNGSSSSPSLEEDDDDEDDEDETEGQPSSKTAEGSSRKRKRQTTGGGGETRQMMHFFEGLMKQVMQKQEAMQQRFLEAIERREQDRMIREEAWKRQEMVRLSREHEIMAQERAISASRDAAILNFLEKITGQTIQLPSPVVTISSAPHPQPPPPSQLQQVLPLAPHVTVSAPLQPPVAQPSPAAESPVVPPPQQQQQQYQQHQRQEVHHQHQQQSISTEIIMAVPEQQVPPVQEIGSGSGSLEPASSRWPKAEVLALIKLRSGLEFKYQEGGPKGPLWEEISAEMQQMGYNRNPKRCKEKWENINKYYKKVKESNKKRPEDSKTCPYFHELDALYRKKTLGSTSGSVAVETTPAFSIQSKPQEQHQQQQQESLQSEPLSAPQPQDRSDPSSIIQVATQLKTAFESQNKTGEGKGGATAKKPEDIVKELMEHQGIQQQQQRQQQHLMLNQAYDKIEELGDSDNIDHDDEEEEDDEYYDDEDDEELQEERKMEFKIEFQRQNTRNSGGRGNGAASFMAMVQ